MMWLSEEEKECRISRMYTAEEKMKIRKTPITRECFDVDYESMGQEELAEYDAMIKSLEWKRNRLAGSVDKSSEEIRFRILITSLPAEYNIVRF